MANEARTGFVHKRAMYSHFEWIASLSSFNQIPQAVQNAKRATDSSSFRFQLSQFKSNSKAERCKHCGTETYLLSAYT